MGRKTKKNTKGNSQAQSQGASGTTETSAPAPSLTRNAKREIADFAAKLLEICSKTPESVGKEIDDDSEIRALLEKIQKIQSVLIPTEKSRQEFFPAFYKWLNENGVDTSTVEVDEFPEHEYGLKATRDLKEGEKLLLIPRKLMMTVDSAKQSALGPLIAEDKILQVMPNVTLALHLLNEKLNPSSFWKPYIDILPSTYSTPLYWMHDDLQRLKGSPVQGDAMNQCKNIARQYAYFYRLLQKTAAGNNLPLRDNFTFKGYRWAVSSVMTRQNQIPARDGSRATLGLIPLWDMCNHTNGIYTSDYNAELDACECFCLKDFIAGQQILIFYGPRSNGEFLIHNGFVYPENEHDRLCLKLGISKKDPLFAMKSELLGKLNLAPSRSFYLHKGRFPVDGDLLAFLRIFNMDEGVLKEKYCQDSAPGPEELEALKDENQLVNLSTEEKVWSFLHTRAVLLLKTYPFSVEDDQLLLQNSANVSDAAKMAAQLKIGEREILQMTIDYAEKKRDSLKSV